MRVSTEIHGQTTDNQRKVITDGFIKIDHFISEDGVSGSIKATERPAFKSMLSMMTKGDTCVVVAVDRLGRNAMDVLSVVEDFKARGIHLRVTMLDGVDLTSSTGKLIVTMMAALAEMEKNMLIERTKAGLERTKAQGTKLGAPLTIPPEVLKEMIEKKEEGYTYDMLAYEYKIPKNTIHRNLKRWKDSFDVYKSEWTARKSQYESRAN
jgi:DNA invertase Pin-like site-specific DNA recombinase